MPKLSMYRPNRSADYQFLDRTIKEMYTVGGLDVYVHKYLGPIVDNSENPGNADATLPVYDSQNPLFIEDLLLLENRDRAYDPDIFIMRMVYRTQDVDFDLSQFGLFLNGDTLFLTTHYNDMIDTFGRKLMAGDVIEVPNLKDYNPLNAGLVRALPRYYVIQDANFASEGFSQTWLPHLWRIKATPMVASQEFQQIINQPFMPENIWDNGNFYPANEIVNNAILAQAQVEVPLSGYDTVKFYILPTNTIGQPAGAGLTADMTSPTVDGTQPGEGITPTSDGYTLGYLTGDGIAPNGLPVTPGVSFPPNPVLGDYALRLDYFPNRLFRYNGRAWVKIEDKVRTDLDLSPLALTQRSSFVNNTYTVPTTDLGNIPSRQSLSQILKPQADNGDQGGNITPPNPRPPGR